MVSPMPSNTPPALEGADSEVIKRFLKANGATSQVSEEPPSINRKDPLAQQVATLQGTVTLIMEKLQQFELKHRSDFASMKTELTAAATNASSKSLFPTGHSN